MHDLKRYFRLTAKSFRGSLRAVAWLLLYCGGVLVAQADGDALTIKREFFTLPVELEFDAGADNGDATILKLAPAYKLSLTEDWSVVNLDLILLADAPGGIPGRPGNPNPDEGNRTFGLGDLTHISFFTPENTGDLVYGLGFMATLPIATDDVLGSGKWSAGPSFRVVYRTGPWSLGVLGGNQWSYAGDGDRGDINQLMLRGAFRREFNNSWYLVSAPVITANWKADSSDTWMVPLGGGLGKVLGSGSSAWALSVQAYANVIKPDAAPDWMIRFAVAAPIPSGVFR